MERNERTALVCLGKQLRLVDRKVVRCKVRGKIKCRTALVGAQANRLATIAAVLRGKYQLPLQAIEIAPGPAIVSAALQDKHLFGRKFVSGLLVVELRIVLEQLVTSVLRDEQ